MHLWLIIQQQIQDFLSSFLVQFPSVNLFCRFHHHPLLNAPLYLFICQNSINVLGYFCLPKLSLDRKAGQYWGTPHSFLGHNATFSADQCLKRVVPHALSIWKVCQEGKFSSSYFIITRRVPTLPLLLKINFFNKFFIFFHIYFFTLTPIHFNLFSTFPLC